MSLQDPLTILSLIAILPALIVVIFNVTGSFMVLLRYQQSKPNRKLLEPSVSILRPLKGYDDNLQINLESSFLLNYTNYEIILSIADINDPAYPIALALISKYPNVNASLIIGDIDVGVNPKINNLVRGYEQSTSEYIWILDSNIRMEPDSLNRSMNIFLNDSKIGLVHHLPCGINPLSFGAYLDAVYLSCTHARMYTAANTLATTSCVIGKSNLFRKCDLDKCGGLRYFGKYLAEDNIIGSHILDLGFKHQIAPDLAFQSLGNVSFYTFMERRIRWIRVRKYTVFFVTLIESLAECLINSILMAAICFQLFSIPFIHYIIAQWIIWFLLDMNIALQTFFPYRQTNLDIFKFICAWMIRELLAFPIWLIAMIGTEVIWRGQPYQLFTDGTVEPILKSDKDINELLIVVESDQKEFLNS